MRRKPSGNTCSRKRRMNSPASSVIALVLPTETNAAAVTIDEPAVGDGNVMGVAAEIVENLLRPAEGPLGIDNPLDLAQRLQMCGESRRVSSMSLAKLNPIEPPWYGPVCPVVWEGRRRAASTYPDQSVAGLAGI